jgi:hypothetical protein
MARDLWLPSVHGEGIGGTNDNAAAFVAAWLQRLGARAALYRQDDRLAHAANRHAAYLAARTGDAAQESLHVGQGGSAANARVRAAGYVLPRHWLDGSNNVESCAVNHDGPVQAVERLLLSPAHREHLLGEGGFASHTVYGVGSVAAFFVVLICPPEPGE